MLNALLAAVICGICRAKDGGDHISKSIAVLFSGLSIALLSDIISPLGVIITLVLTAPPLTMGMMHAAWNGRYRPNEQHGFARWVGIQWLSNRLYAVTKNGHVAGIVWMSLRWVIASVPLFLWLWFVADHHPLLIVGLLAQGVIYWLAGQLGLAIRPAEYVTGGWFGFLAVIGGGVVNL